MPQIQRSSSAHCVGGAADWERRDHKILYRNDAGYVYLDIHLSHWSTVGRPSLAATPGADLIWVGSHSTSCTSRGPTAWAASIRWSYCRPHCGRDPGFISVVESIKFKMNFSLVGVSLAWFHHNSSSTILIFNFHMEQINKTTHGKMAKNGELGKAIVRDESKSRVLLMLSCYFLILAQHFKWKWKIISILNW